MIKSTITGKSELPKPAILRSTELPFLRAASRAEARMPLVLLVVGIKLTGIRSIALQVQQIDVIVLTHRISNSTGKVRTGICLFISCPINKFL